MSTDEQDHAESFDEDLVVADGDDDTDVSSQYPPDHYEGVFDPAVTEAGDARVESIQKRILREEVDPLVEELDRKTFSLDDSWSKIPVFTAKLGGCGECRNRNR